MSVEKEPNLFFIGKPQETKSKYFLSLLCVNLFALMRMCVIHISTCVCVCFYGCPCNQEAEEMHIKAIQIKEQLLGHEDYEVALSVGHLASLYNYDMNQYEDAERLYLRSIAIGQSRGRDGWVTNAGCHFLTLSVI